MIIYFFINDKVIMSEHSKKIDYSFEHGLCPDKNHVLMAKIGLTYQIVSKRKKDYIYELFEEYKEHFKNITQFRKYFKIEKIIKIFTKDNSDISKQLLKSLENYAITKAQEKFGDKCKNYDSNGEPVPSDETETDLDNYEAHNLYMIYLFNPETYSIVTIKPTYATYTKPKPKTKTKSSSSAGSSSDTILSLNPVSLCVLNSIF